MKTIRLALLFLVISTISLSAQSSLSIVDVLPPYDLTATLLANGHFSISTRYTGQSKTLVYQEDGTGGRPVNYTSHVHFKVDDIIFQLPYELNPVTREAPPQHPMEITGLYRDTIAGTPRINARMIGVMPDGDTMRFLFTMQPVKRPSGGFIRLSAEVHNTTSRKRAVGVLMLIDTKIGDNDRAPIISSFGYETTETEFELGTPPGMPEFWLGLEGTPTGPQLTARGNLRAPGLIEPDYFLFGNWKDNTAVPGATGLAIAQWDERRAFDFEYTDSAILLLWKQDSMQRGEQRLRASTEIGIVDSLNVSNGGGIGLGGAGGGGGGGGGIGGGGCLSFDTLMQNPCDDPNYHPYIPDSLQSLYLVTNTGTIPLDNVRIVVPQVPAGLSVGVQSSSVIPALLPVTVTGVASLTFHAQPRLRTKNYSIPIAVVANSTADTLLRDTICLTVPGLLGDISIEDVELPPLCPGRDDTIDVPVQLDGVRCLDLLPGAILVGGQPDLGQFSIVPPLPTQIPANGQVMIRVRYTAAAPGVGHQVGLQVFVTDSGLDTNDQPASEVVSATAIIKGTSRDAEFFFATPADTLDLGAVCVGDTAVGEWHISNIGGCELSILNVPTFENDPRAQFSVANAAEFPMEIERRRDSTVQLRFSPVVQGIAEARIIVRSNATPFLDTLVVRGRGDVPAFTVTNPPLTLDTLCPGERFTASIPVSNPTACAVEITSLTTDTAAFTVDDPNGFTLPPQSNRFAIVEGAFDTPGEYTTEVTITSALAGEQKVNIRAVVASRELTVTPIPDFGDVRLGQSSASRRVTIQSIGTAGAEISSLRLTGANSSEYSYTLPNGETFPLWLPPGGSLDIDLVFSPTDLEARRAFFVIEATGGKICQVPAPVEAAGRGILPVIDAPRRLFNVGRICAGRSVDTTIVLRNFGNAPLTVTGLVATSTQGRLKVNVVGLPVVIQPDTTSLVRLSMQPELLGPFNVDILFRSDGDWFTPQDSVVRIGGTGVICGTVWADTIRASVGDVVEVPVHIDPSPLSLDEMTRLMNESNARSINLSIGHDSRLVRFLNRPPEKGMMSSLLPAATVTPSGTSVKVTGSNGGGNLVSSNLIATLKADVLLGDKERSVLALSVESFADGFADLTVHNGLLIGEYCAIDKRYVQFSGPIVYGSATPMLRAGSLVLYLPEASHARVSLFDAFGDRIAILLDEPAGAGTRTLPLPSHLMASGVYTVLLETDRDAVTARLVVIE